MPVKISKVAKDLNVGTQTLIDFLSKKKITVDSNPNARISDEHYQMLLNEFKTDKDQRIKSDNFISERRQEKAKPASAPAATEQSKEQPKPEMIKTTVEPVQAPKIIGKIDLNKPVKPAAPKPEPAKPQPEAHKKEQPKPQQPAAKPVANQAPEKPETKAAESELTATNA